MTGDPLQALPIPPHQLQCANAASQTALAKCGGHCHLPVLHGFQIQGKGWGWVWWPTKKQKKAAIQEVALHRVSPPLGVGGGGGVMVSLFNMGRSRT